MLRKEIPSSPEVNRVIDKVYVFDVDGVITSPDSGQFDREVMEKIAQSLRNGQPVILNTGRSISWLQEKLVARLYYAHNLKDKDSLKNLFMIGEKGGVSLGFRDDGMMDPNPHIETDMPVPKEISDKIRSIVENNFRSTMFFDTTKKTMVTAEMWEGTNLEHFRQDQKLLSEEIKKLLKQMQLEDKFVVDSTTIATDLQNKAVGKGFAMKAALKWLNEKGIKVQNFVTFGDSLSDFDMAIQLNASGNKVEHVHVGSVEPNQDFPFKIIRTSKKFNKGTAQFLQEN